MTRRDPLPALTALGLIGCALLATLHPTEALDLTSPERQAGRFVLVSLDILAADTRDGWARGSATSTTATAAGPPPTIHWTWFRPPDAPPLGGDRIDGRAKVERGAHGVALVLDGAHAAVITPGPHPVPVRWDDLVARPEAYAGRALVLRGHVVDATLFGPEGDTCPLTAAAPTDAEQHVVRLVRLADAPGWRCAWEGAA